NIGNLGAHFDVVASWHYSTTHQRGNAQIVSYLLQIYVLSLELESRAARLHLELRCMGETVGKRFRDAAAGRLRIRIPAYIGEGEHSNGVNLRCLARAQVPSANCRQCDDSDAGS